MSAYLFADGEQKVFTESYGSPSVASQCNFSWWDDVTPLTELCQSPFFVGTKGRRIKSECMSQFKSLVEREPETTGYDDSDKQVSDDRKCLLDLIQWCIDNDEILYVSI